MKIQPIPNHTVPLILHGKRQNFSWFMALFLAKDDFIYKESISFGQNTQHSDVRVSLFFGSAKCGCNSGLSYAL
jgi:hypothetical protein